MPSFNDTPGQSAEYTVAACQHFRYADGDPRIWRLGLGAPALELIGLGYAAGPSRRGGKPPHAVLGSDGGVHHATRDPRRALEWWGQDLMANVFVRTGSLPFAGRQVVVADLDTKHGEDGPGTFARFLTANGLALPPGLPAGRSPTGGMHLWMGWPRHWGPCPRRIGLLPGVDVIGDDSYVLAPPSLPAHLRQRRPRRRARRADPPPLYVGAGLPLPAAGRAAGWFGEWISTAVATGLPRGTAGVPGDVVDAEKIMANGAETGKRNVTLHSLACSRFRKHGTGHEGAPRCSTRSAPPGWRGTRPACRGRRWRLRSPRPGGSSPGRNSSSTRCTPRGWHAGGHDGAAARASSGSRRCASSKGKPSQAQALMAIFRDNLPAGLRCQRRSVRRRHPPCPRRRHLAAGQARAAPAAGRRRARADRHHGQRRDAEHRADRDRGNGGPGRAAAAGGTHRPGGLTAGSRWTWAAGTAPRSARARRLGADRPRTSPVPAQPAQRPCCPSRCGGGSVRPAVEPGQHQGP